MPHYVIAFLVYLVYILFGFGIICGWGSFAVLYSTDMQYAKKVVSDSPGLVDSILDLPDKQVKFFCGIQITEEL